MNPDVIGVNEIENDGYGPTSALADLVGQLNDGGAGTYAFIDADAGTGQVDAIGTDAIKVGVLYKPAGSRRSADRRPQHRRLRQRRRLVAAQPPTVAQAFAVNATGERFIVAVTT